MSDTKKTRAKSAQTTPRFNRKALIAAAGRGIWLDVTPAAMAGSLSLQSQETSTVEEALGLVKKWNAPKEAK